MMATFSLTLKFLLVLFLTGQSGNSILVGDEKPVTKPSPQLENLDWHMNFGPLASYGPIAKKASSQYNDLTHNSLCPSGETGQFPYPPDCRRFINCWKGRGMVQVCGPGTLFNPVSRECDYPDKVACESDGQYGISSYTRFPVNRPDISESSRVSRKENYQLESIPATTYPGRPTYFGPSHLTRPPTRPTQSPREKLVERVECPKDAVGLYPHPTDCSSFLNCWGGRTFIQKCGPGTYFNPSSGVCDFSQSVRCGPDEYKEPDTVAVPPIKNSRDEVEIVVEERPQPTNEDDEVLYNSASNLYDVRTKTEEKNTKGNRGQVEFDEEKTERDPSWGKILNWGEGKKKQQHQKTDGNRLYYDAHGNPINSNQYWLEIGKPLPQHPTGPHHQPSSHHTGDSNIYYLRPHNHVMNQYPPQLQGHLGVQNPIFHNHQQGRPLQNPQPSNTNIPGHFILVEDPKLKETKVVHESHQRNDELATYLVPPRPDGGSVVSTPNNVPNHNVPSSVLLPPRIEETQLHHQFHKYDYSGWKPYNSIMPSEDVTRVSAPGQTESAPSRVLLPPLAETSQTFNQPSKNDPVNNNDDGKHDSTVFSPFIGNSSDVPARGSESVTQRDSDIIRWKNKQHSSSITTSETTTTENWSKFYLNKNPYGFSLSASTEKSVATSPTEQYEDITKPTTGHVYVVYPVKNHNFVEEQVQPVHNNPTESGHDHSHRGEVEEAKKKQIKSEFESEDSNDSLGVRDVEIYNPTIEELLPHYGKNVRLKSLSSHLDGYVEVKGPDGQWGLVCDANNGWMIPEANVVCRELGYGRGAQISWQGYPLDSSSESIPVSVSQVKCNGSEESFLDCDLVYWGQNCDITKHAVGLRCFDNVTTQCHPEEVEFNNNCYRLITRDNLDDAGFTMEEAADYCKTVGGRITDIVNEEENNFISEWLMDKHPDVRSVLTGGIGSAVMGRSLWMWFGSDTPMHYQKWWKGWAGENEIKQGTVHGPVCVVLRKSFPCFIQEGNDAGESLELGNVEPEYCSANYFYWDIEDCHKMNELKLPHICKKPLEEVGCVVGRGEDYSGTASITSSGLPCLPWDTPEVKEKLSHQITLQEWSTKLSGHNFCRNLGRQELHPWCFVAGKENSEYCSIPQCWDSVPGYSKSASSTSSCDETHFECRPGECVKRGAFCDGKKDCSNGRDEAMCNIFLQEFSTVNGKRMMGHEREKWPGVNDNTCAKHCLESKKYRCKSFSYNQKTKTCILSDTNLGLSGDVVPRRDWTYHELLVTSLNCSLGKSMMECRNGKCVNNSNICDGKDHCGDGSDEVNCERLGYQIRLTGSNETHKGRVEVKVLGKWGSICDDRFDLRDGSVVCRELGFKHGVAEILNSGQFPTDNPVFMVDELECLGNESSIRECQFPGWGSHDCKSEEAVGVVCRVPNLDCPDEKWHCSISKECIPISYLCDTVKDCDDGSDENETSCNEPVKVRLAGGPNATAGRLEIKRLGTWGTICDDGFNDRAANVICRILGYHGPSSVLKNAYFGPGKGPIWLDEVYCFGNETSILECTHSSWGKHNCKHDEDVSIICSELYIGQKSSAFKPVAHSASTDTEGTPIEKLKKVLLERCSEDINNSLQSLGREAHARVVGSDVVPLGIPWQASVRVKSAGGKSSHWCGAVIISPYHILTAGHCLRDYSKPAYFIRVGDFDTEIIDEEEQEFGIDHLYIHPEFNKKLHLNNDIALVKIKGEMKLGKRVRPACLVPSTDIYQPETNCSISGWGSTSTGSTGFARTLRRAYIPILEPSLCRAPFVYGDNLSDGMFCAGKLDGGVDSCQGDSGGPIMCQFEEKEYLFGITSWGHGCGRANKPGVYTNVGRYSDWIQEKMELSMA